MRKLKPIPEIVNLTSAQRDQLHGWFERGITYQQVMADFESTFGVPIKYHKIYRYFHCWQHAKELQKHSGDAASHLEILGVLHGEAAPWSELTQHLVQKAACAMAANPENSSIDLHRLMRIANNPVSQDLARERVHIHQEKLALEKRKQSANEKLNAPPEPAKKLTQEEQLERMWDIFNVSEEERARRRAINKARAEQEAAQAVQAAAAGKNGG
jgi:hypothetical protein